MSQYQPMYDSFHHDARDRYVPTSRINVAASVRLPGSEVDPYTGQLKPDHVRRRRTQAKRLEEIRLEEEDRRLKASLEREMKKTGVRVNWISAVVICSVLLFICLFTIGYQRSVISDYQDQLNAQERDIRIAAERKDALTGEWKEASDIGRIGSYAARNLGMIRAESVEPVQLTAVDTRPLAVAQRIQPVVQTIDAAAVQSTQAPVSASAGN